MKFIKAHILQMDTEHLCYIDAEKITSMHTMTMCKPGPEVVEGEEPTTITETVTVVNLAGQQPLFVKESPRMLLTEIKKEA